MWTCPKCKESIEDQFDRCWRCAGEAQQASGGADGARELGKGTAYLIIVLFAMSPVLCAMLASLIAKLCGSRLDEGGAHPCIVLGVDIGGLLYGMLTLGWLSLITVPIGLICIAVVAREFLKGKKRNVS